MDNIFKKPRMKPLNKYIIVSEVKEEQMADTGLVMSGTDMNNMRYNKAEVVAPGTEVETVNPGDVVYYDKRQSFKMIIEEKPVTIILERDIVVVL